MCIEKKKKTKMKMLSKRGYQEGRQKRRNGNSQVLLGKILWGKFRAVKRGKTEKKWKAEEKSGWSDC